MFKKKIRKEVGEKTKDEKTVIYRWNEANTIYVHLLTGVLLFLAVGALFSIGQAMWYGAISNYLSDFVMLFIISAIIVCWALIWWGCMVPRLKGTKLNLKKHIVKILPFLVPVSISLSYLAFTILSISSLRSRLSLIIFGTFIIGFRVVWELLSFWLKYLKWKVGRNADFFEYCNTPISYSSDDASDSEF